MLLFTGITQEIWEGAFEWVDSPVGNGKVRIWDYNVTHHQIACVVLLIVLVLILNFVVNRTRFGVQLRAMSDDFYGAEMVGVPVKHVATLVWTATGVLAGLGGVMLTTITALSNGTVLFVLIRSLAGAAFGGFNSVLLALAGAMIYGQVESHVGAGSFGAISSGWREIILMGVLFAGILLVTRLRKNEPAGDPLLRA